MVKYYVHISGFFFFFFFLYIQSIFLQYYENVDMLIEI